jgi:hypothetical protein
MALLSGRYGEAVESRIDIVQGRTGGECDVEIELRFPKAIRKCDAGQIRTMSVRERFQVRIEHGKRLE